MKKQTSYRPPQEILEKYAKVLVNFALGGGKGIKKGDVVAVYGNEASKPLYAEVLRAIWKAGGHVLPHYSPDNEPWFKFDRVFYEHAKEHQLKHFPAKHMRGLVDDSDHTLFIIADTDKRSLSGIDPKKIMMRGMARKPYMDWRFEKEALGKYTWTIGLYGTPMMAREAHLSEKEYWDQIIKACFLDEKNPIAKWKEVYKKMSVYQNKLNKLKVEKLHVVGQDADLWIKLGAERAWASGSGRNIPSFELFTSPDWRGTEGWIRFNQPLYRYGNLIDGIELEFKNGKVVRSKARKNESVLKAMIATKNADKVGEFSLTDRRFSRITKFMGETLFDENMGGPFGNTHIAVGSSYHECFAGDQSKPSKKEWEKMGYNDSSVHTDIVSTTDRTVTAYLKDGSQRVIYKNGQFVL
jgi:aminopeptidase